MTKFKVPVRCKTKVTMYYDHYVEVEASCAKEAIDKAIGMDMIERRTNLSDDRDDFTPSTDMNDVCRMEDEAFGNKDLSNQVEVLDDVSEDDVF